VSPIRIGRKGAVGRFVSDQPALVVELREEATRDDVIPAIGV